MGCASGSLATANGKIMDAAKGAATDAVNAGEEALNDVKSSVTETVSNVKEAVVGAVQNVGHGIESAFNGNSRKENPSVENPDIKDIGVIANADSKNGNLQAIDDDPNFIDIPLEDPAKTTEPSKGALDKLSDMMNSKSKKYQSEAEKLTDDLIKETDDVVAESLNTTNQHFSSAINQAINETNTAVNGSPVHSLNSLETNSPEPEIEKAMSNGNKANPPTPKPTLSELENIHSEIASSIVHSGMGIIDVTASQFDNTVSKINGSNGQVLVSAE